MAITWNFFTLISWLMSLLFFFFFSGGLQLLATFLLMQWFCQLLCTFGKYPTLWPLHTCAATIMLQEGMSMCICLYKLSVIESNRSFCCLLTHLSLKFSFVSVSADPMLLRDTLYGQSFSSLYYCILQANWIAIISHVFMYTEFQGWSKTLYDYL